MKLSSRPIRRALWTGGVVATATATAMIVVALTSSVSAQSTSTTGINTTGGTNAKGPGYPPPNGIYKPFTNCPLNNPVMHEDLPITDAGGGFAACIAGNATSGSITIGNITTTVVQPVNVQFGFFIPPKDDNFYPAPAVPPLAGPSAILSTKPDLIPEPLTQALGCPSSDPTVENICQQAQTRGGIYNQVFALAQEAGAPITNFMLFNWTQGVKFKLINPLLGSNCYIGSDEQPVVLNPNLSVAPGGQVFFDPDPAPTVHPDTFVLGITVASASDSTFSVPFGVTGCGPGGVPNVAVDEALDTSSGLPAASGTNSLTLTGTFVIAATTASEDSSLTQPQDDAGDLLAAFKASTNGEHSVKHLITTAQMQAMLSPRS
jgi:hypothetical protein